ncbi:MAG: hypothetical protein DRP26_05900 [Candidatus Zixiibacteriota bacterium]|nr:MAG: hypothetical protein DRP26_05900 [candidate division Zixibacteria bacterium]
MLLKKEALVRKLVILGLLAGLIFVAGCEKTTTEYVYLDEYPPPPSGITSVTADEAVYMYWHPVEVDDIDGYLVYRNTSETGTFTLKADISHPDTDWVDTEVINGNTYYYRLSAYDESGNESDLSEAFAMDTPRPEGFDEVIYDYYYEPNYSGFDLYLGEVVRWDSEDCDIYLDYDVLLDAFFINVRFEDYYIQDFGYADDFDDVGYAPPDGWSGFNSIEAIEGHMYVLKLRHFGEWHYARVWVTDLFFDYDVPAMEFAWAYQIDPGNRELKIVPGMPKHVETIVQDN